MGFSSRDKFIEEICRWQSGGRHPTKRKSGDRKETVDIDWIEEDVIEKGIVGMPGLLVPDLIEERIKCCSTVTRREATQEQVTRTAGKKNRKGGSMAGRAGILITSRTPRTLAHLIQFTTVLGPVL